MDTKHNDLLERLRALSRHEHSDLSIGDEAADEITALRLQIAAHEQQNRVLMSKIQWAAITNGELNGLREEIRRRIAGVL
jgi:hypothetical protein